MKMINLLVVLVNELELITYIKALACHVTLLLKNANSTMIMENINARA